ncbi:YhcN/YlaJ family sporulation lipoprotein [Paenibacillus mesotrionivorans]|uniref:YhcN/YlaJ family sporulation lipoprotein n=1 Tax=Paenibacillus mesotrionivorans TaxID=3160968 RepID=A0ACC7NYH9_9BACL
MRVRLWILLIALAAAAAGCGKAGHQAGEGDNNNLRAQQAQTANPQESDGLPADTATRLEDLAKGIAQVEDAKCVILGKTAIVGITVEPNLDRSRVNIIKYSVAEAFRKDPEGINAFVTADMALGERIRHVRDDIRNGRPFSGFAQELGDIIGRVAPQIPKDIAPMDNGKHHDPDGSQFQDNNL